jgi:succinate dehydrogenase / fumarate reductase cytochrome b subunit
MSILSPLLNTAKGALTYRGREGQLAWFGHRLAGLGTLLFFTTHVIDTSWVFFWPEGYGHAIALYRTAPFLIGELLLFLAIIYHGFNGLRITFMDMRPSLWKYQRQLTLATFVLTAAAYAPVFFIMMSHIVELWPRVEIALR